MPAANPPGQVLHLDDGASLTLWRDLLGPSSTPLMAQLRTALPWQQPAIRVFGRHTVIPRMQCWMGDAQARYRYSGLTLEPVPWHPELERLRRRVEACCQQLFNAVLINYYRDGADRMGWHSDDEPELGPAPWIASYNLGATRSFVLRRRGETRTRHSIELGHDQLLLMSPGVQHRWQHALPIRRSVQDARINLTFRLILPTPD